MELMNQTLELQDFAETGFNPMFSDDLALGDVDNPYPALRELLKRGQVVEADFREVLGLAPDVTLVNRRKFTALGYDAVRQVLSDTENFDMHHHKEGIGLTFGAFSLTALDPPEHTRYRRIFQKAFLPQYVGTWSKEFIEPVVDDLISKFIDRGHCDLIKEFVFPYPFEIIYRQLRLPPQEADIFQRLSLILTLYPVEMKRAQEAHIKLGDYFRALIPERRKNPGTDLVSVLATVDVDGEFLPVEVLVSFFRQLLNAAGDTTYRSTGNMLTLLLSDRPDQFEMIKKDRSLIAKAIEETLRFEGPVSLTTRCARRDTELFGVKIPADSLINILTGMANRDPSVYPDPDRFDLTRVHPRSHMAFAAGPHICLGQHLARLEMTRAMNILLDRLPKLRLDPAYPKPHIHHAFMRVPRTLHVRFD
jgi:cytochrome P450